ncbi:hypothetical protein [Nitrospira sp. BLG_2]|uniref:hypothetical protein n=1 Tax=Nitrospira sp. BLG_2 TaxID=3397507 RepID=UPI003B9C0686
MLNSLLFALSLLVGSPEVEAKPAYFEISVEAKTPYTVYLNGDQIDANRCYKTQFITENIKVEIEIRYVCGGEVIKSKATLELEPGYKKTMTIKLSARPLLAWC